MHTKHVMIDLETLSTENDAAIIAVGAVEFDLEIILQERIWTIDPQLSPGRRDESTLLWWGEQDPETSKKMWAGKLSPAYFARDFALWVGEFFSDHWIWAAPATFDLSILKTYYNQYLGFEFPLNWRNLRDLTTVSRLANELGIDYSGEDFAGFEAHNALSDCIKQARRTQIILKHLDALACMRNDLNTQYSVPGL